MSNSSERPQSSQLLYRAEQAHQDSSSPTLAHPTSARLNSTSHQRRITTNERTQSSPLSPGAGGGPVRSTGNSAADLRISTGATLQRNGSNDDLSANAQDSPGALHFATGSPGVTRRAKAHVPSACVNCKRKHLACETRRPCSRCLQAGKEVSKLRDLGLDGYTADKLKATCVDVQHKKRGRPRLRDEDSGRGVHFGSEYSHPHLYPAQPDMSGSSHRPHHPSGSYRELRSQPAILYADLPSSRSAASRTSDPGSLIQAQEPRGLRVLDSSPTALLTLDFVIARSNYAFSDALSIRANTEGISLRDLIILSERDKIQRLQNSLRAELQDVAQLPPIRSSLNDSNFNFVSGEHDLLGATSGFQPRSEYWTFRLPNDQSRGFPITICLARTTDYFIVLTLVSSSNTLSAIPTPLASQGGWTQSLPSPNSVHSTQSPTLERQLDRNNFNGANQTKLSYHLASSPATSIVPETRPHLLQPSHDLRLPQYGQRSPPQHHDSHISTPSAPGTTRSTVQGSEIPRNNLRHLQLPPIRTTGIGEGERSTTSKANNPAGRQSSVKDSPQSAKKKKRQRVDIGEMLH
ncbi:hypothetical protein MMC24_000048 [Lignoscripta atroalba]|nr:hypothetical protein [Lignoscripta atroalba]